MQTGAATGNEHAWLAEGFITSRSLARQIIAQVVAEQHGVTMIAEELAKNENAASAVVDELMKQPTVARTIADR